MRIDGKRARTLPPFPLGAPFVAAEFAAHRSQYSGVVSDPLARIPERETTSRLLGSAASADFLAPVSDLAACGVPATHGCAVKPIRQALARARHAHAEAMAASWCGRTAAGPARRRWSSI